MTNKTGRIVRPLPQGRIIDDCRHDLAMGAVLGALIGDAAGATLEFLGYCQGNSAVGLRHA